MHGVELFHQFSSRILQNVSLCSDRQTDSVDQDQTAQTVKSDVGFTLSVNLWDIYFVKNITLKWHYIQVLTIYSTFFQQVMD